MKTLNVVMKYFLYIVPVILVLCNIPIGFTPPSVDVSYQHIRYVQYLMKWIVLIISSYLPLTELFSRYEKKRNEDTSIKEKFYLYSLFFVKNSLAVILALLFVTVSLFYTEPIDSDVGIYSTERLIIILSVYWLWGSILLHILFEPIPGILKRYIQNKTVIVSIVLRSLNISIVFIIAMISGLFLINVEWANLLYWIIIHFMAFGTNIYLKNRGKREKTIG